MFSDIDKETSDRLAEAKWYLDNITEYHNSPQEIFKEKLYKGSFFVNLYGAIEYMYVVWCHGLLIILMKISTSKLLI